MIVDGSLGIKKPPVLFLAGPTASGKTSLAIQLYQQFPCTLINVDAAQVYKGMDIGTAKISEQEQKDFPHELINIREPWQTYSAADFCQDVTPIIEKAWAENRLPVLVGGSMFYFHALEHGLSQLPQADDSVRQQIGEYKEKRGQEGLYHWLSQVDKLLADKLSVNDSQRIQRALEIYCLTGKPASDVFKEDEQSRNALSQSANIVKVALAKSNRSELHQLIAKRYQLMIDDGLVEEVTRLHQNPHLNEQMMSMKIVGYRQTWQYLDGHDTLQSSIDKGVAATRQLAKRQLTWLRNQPGMTWFNVDDVDQAKSALSQYITSSLAYYFHKF